MNTSMLRLRYQLSTMLAEISWPVEPVLNPETWAEQMFVLFLRWLTVLKWLSGQIKWLHFKLPEDIQMETEQIKEYIESVVPDMEKDFVIGFAYMGGLLDGELTDYNYCIVIGKKMDYKILDSIK